MHTDDIRVSPWLPTIRLKGLLLIFACVGIGIVIGRMTVEKIVVTQDRLPTAAELAALQTASPPSANVGRATTPEPGQRSRPISHEEAPKKVTPPVIVINPGTADAREPGRSAGMIGGRQTDRPPIVERGLEGRGNQPPARDYRALRDYMLNR
jgi:hypothetical protein